MRNPLHSVLLFLVAATFAVHGARGEDSPTVWTGLVYASNEPGDIAPELEPYKAKLEHIFGYTRFTLIGQHSELMDEPSEHWLVPGKTFSLQATGRHSPDGPGYLMHLELFYKQHMLVDTKVWLAPKNPLLIRGPLHGRGQLVIILLVK